MLQDASRLVFVSVKDAKPKRKVAVPIPENGSWDLFVGQVKAKLKLAGVGDIYLASTGERVVRLDQLQDIDELYVTEVRSRLSMVFRNYSSSSFADNLWYLGVESSFGFISYLVFVLPASGHITFFNSFSLAKPKSVLIYTYLKILVQLTH